METYILGGDFYFGLCSWILLFWAVLIWNILAGSPYFVNVAAAYTVAGDKPNI